LATQHEIPVKIGLGMAKHLIFYALASQKLQGFIYLSRLNIHHL
jgi:hypothetical protein